MIIFDDQLYMIDQNTIHHFSQKDITAQVKRICASADLRAKEQLCKLLKYLVKESLAGKGAKLKGYTIGVEVFNKEVGFDAEHDPLVRIHAGRLRRMLRMYYLEAGKNDPIMIGIPKGQYIPEFSLNKDQTIKQVVSKVRPHIHSSPGIAILPFKNISGDPDKDYFALGLAEEISVELIKFEDLTVLESIPLLSAAEQHADITTYLNDSGVRFILEGSVFINSDRIKILARLTDRKKGEQIWAERYLMDLSVNSLIEIQDNISTKVSRILGSEYGIIMQRISKESNSYQFQKIETFHALSKFYYFEAHQTPEAAEEALAALEQAISKEPASGIAHAMLAALYSNRYLLDAPGSDQAFENMSTLAEKALALSPNSLTVRLIFAVKCFFTGKKDRFFQEVEHCLSNNIRGSMRLGALGFYLALQGEWEQGKAILDRIMKTNIGFPLYYYGLTSLYYYRQRAYNESLLELDKYNMPTIFWAPMQRIAVLGQLNRPDEAQDHLAHLAQLRPDFEQKARDLISRLVKEPSLVDHLLEGLQKAGLKVS